MKYYLINEQDIYDLLVEIENCVFSLLSHKEVGEHPEEGDKIETEETEAININTNY